jgi:hypothetical protein
MLYLKSNEVEVIRVSDNTAIIGIFVVFIGYFGNYICKFLIFLLWVNGYASDPCFI